MDLQTIGPARNRNQYGQGPVSEGSGGLGTVDKSTPTLTVSARLKRFSWRNRMYSDLTLRFRSKTGFPAAFSGVEVEDLVPGGQTAAITVSVGKKSERTTTQRHFSIFVAHTACCRT